MDFGDPLVRELLASKAYYEDRADEAAADQEHIQDAVYFCVAWDSLTAEVQRPYRKAVEVSCQAFATERVL